MKIEYLRGFLKKTPFQAFEVKTASGETHRMTHREAVTISPNGDLLILWPADGGMVLIDAEQVTEALYPPIRKTKVRRSE